MPRKAEILNLKMLDLEFGTMQYRKFLLSPGLMPIDISVEAVFRVIDSVFKLTYFRKKTCATFKVDRTYTHIARSLFVAEKSLARSRENLSVVLCDNVVENGKM